MLVSGKTRDEALSNIKVLRGLFPLLLALLWASALAADSGTWEVWDDCHLEAGNKYFDGDSFRVSHGGENVILRLYFIDTPEIESGRGGRVAEQATHFHVTDADVVTAGRTAREFTEQFLSRPFRVITRRQIAPGASRGERYYAVVESNGRRLDAALIEAGLARSIGEVADYPDAASGKKTMKDISVGEQKAANERRGLWAHSSGRVEQATVRVGV